MGPLITITSQTARHAMPFVGAHYVSSKAAIIAFTRVLALEVAPHAVTANCLAPGLANTRMADVFDHDAYSQSVPLAESANPLTSPRQSASSLRTRPPTSPAPRST